jgi:geranylgeranyl reductase family protein
MLFWGGETISMFGTQVTLLALPLTAVLLLGATAAQLSLVRFLETAPYLLFTLIFGAWVDRLRRRPVLIVANGARCLLIGTIPALVLFDMLTLPSLAVIAFGAGIFTVLFDVAWAAYTPTLVHSTDLVEANGKMMTSYASAEVAGPGLAGVLIQWLSAPFALIADAASYLVAMVTLLLIRAPEPRPEAHPDSHLLREIGQGLRLVMGDVYLRAIAVMSGLWNFFYLVASTIFFLYAVRELGLSPATLGIILAVGACGGLIGASLAAVGDGIHVPVRDEVSSCTFTLRGKREQTRVHRTPMLAMVLRDEFDDELRRAAAGAGAVLREHCLVRGLSQQPDLARVHLAAGEEVTARVVVGADGSSGVSARHAGVRYAEVDLGLELEILVPPPVRNSWRGRILLDWGALPGSYAWVFPKDDRLTVGVIATRGHADYTRQYLRDFVARLGLAGYGTAQDSGHLTRCRADDSPVRRGRVLVAGDAAGLLEPCTREGISFALRSGRLAGQVAARAAQADRAAQAGGAGPAGPPDQELDRYLALLGQELIPEMRAGRLLLRAFARHPGLFHAGLATPRGWRAFVEVCSGDASFHALADRTPSRLALTLVGRI